MALLTDAPAPGEITIPRARLQAYHAYIIYKYIAFLRIQTVFPAAQPMSRARCLGRAQDSQQRGHRRSVTEPCRCAFLVELPV